MAPTVDDKIATATKLLAIAEQELQLALKELEVIDRADKRMVNVVVQGAFEKLSAARAALDEARSLQPTPR